MENKKLVKLIKKVKSFYPLQWYLKDSVRDFFEVKYNYNSNAIEWTTFTELETIEVLRWNTIPYHVIREHFKNNTYDYMEKYSNYYTTAEETDKVSIYDNEDYFTFQLKVKDKVVCEKIFSGNDYPPNVRYDVDIRKIIPKIIDYLQQGLSMENYTKNYCGYNLDRIFINN